MYIFQKADIYDVSTASIVYTVTLNGRANDVCFLDDDKFILAGDMPELEVHSIEDKKQVGKFKAHERRVRCLHLLSDQLEDDSRVFVSASNDGWIKVWKVKVDDDEVEADCISEYDTKCRITCMTVHKVPEVVETKKVESEAVKKARENEVKKTVSKKAKKRVSLVEPCKDDEGDQESESKKVKLVEYQEKNTEQQGKKGKRKKKKSM